MRTIQLRDAKARLSAVIDDACRGTPSVITRHGRLLMASPLEDTDFAPRDAMGLPDPDF